MYVYKYIYMYIYTCICRSLQTCLLAKQEIELGTVATQCVAIAMPCDAMRCQAVCACEE